MTKLLFVTSTCPNCVTAKKEAEQMSDCEIIYADTEDGLKLAEEYGVFGVPTWVDKK